MQLFLGGSVVSALVNPLLWVMFAGSCLFAGQDGATFARHTLTSISAIGLLGGNAVLTWMAIAAPKRRGWDHLAPYGFTVSLYWMLISIAAWRGPLQLFTRPFHWEKTAHGLSRFEQIRP